MTLELETLETSFDLIAPRGEELVDVFYARLFEAAPSVKPLFAHTDLAKQKAMLLATLVLLRKSLRDLDSIAPKLRQLGARHVGYGARPEHYPVVADVMLASMAEIAGEAWTNEIAAAWSAALNLVATAMLEGAEEAEAAARPRAAHPPCGAAVAVALGSRA
jgi:methyl-accepting chemotaxis protein